MNEKELKDRTKQFALRIIRLVSSLPKTREGNILGTQLLRSGTSIGANYREAIRARSRAEFIPKLGVVEQEADETLYWLELLQESKTVKDFQKIQTRKSKIQNDDITKLIKEADELVAIFTSSGKTSKKSKLANPRSKMRSYHGPK
jgi:four helix bundle protein